MKRSVWLLLMFYWGMVTEYDCVSLGRRDILIASLSFSCFWERESRQATAILFRAACKATPQAVLCDCCLEQRAKPYLKQYYVTVI